MRAPAGTRWTAVAVAAAAAPPSRQRKRAACGCASDAQCWQRQGLGGRPRPRCHTASRRRRSLGAAQPANISASINSRAWPRSRRCCEKREAVKCEARGVNRQTRVRSFARVCITYGKYELHTGMRGVIANGTVGIPDLSCVWYSRFVMWLHEWYV